LEALLQLLDLSLLKEADLLRMPRALLGDLIDVHQVAYARHRGA